MKMLIAICGGFLLGVAVTVAFAALLAQGSGAGWRSRHVKASTR